LMSLDSSFEINSIVPVGGLVSCANPEKKSAIKNKGKVIFFI